MEREQALETVSLLVGGQRARGCCLEMTCADFLAGDSLEYPIADMPPSWKFITSASEAPLGNDDQEKLITLYVQCHARANRRIS